VAEAVRKRRGAAFQPSEDPFNGMPISVAFCLNSASRSVKCSLEGVGAIDEKDGGFGVVFVPKFSAEHLGERGRSRRKQPDVKQIVRFRITSGVQPELLVVDPNHCLVEPNPIRGLSGIWL